MKSPFRILRRNYKCILFYDPEHIFTHDCFKFNVLVGTNALQATIAKLSPGPAEHLPIHFLPYIL